MAIWKVVLKTSTAFVQSDRMRRSDGIFFFFFMTLKICLFPQQTLKSQGDSFIVSRHLPCQTESHVPVSPFVLTGTWCLWKSPAQLPGMSRFHPPPRRAVAEKLFPWCANVVTPGSFAPEAAPWRGARFPVLFSQQHSPCQQVKMFLSGFEIRENCLLETWQRHRTSLCTSHQGTVF